MKTSRTSQLSMQSLLDSSRISCLDDSHNSMIIITDVISGINDASKFRPLLDKNSNQKPNKLYRICLNPQLWLILTLISVLATIYVYCIDYLCLSLFMARIHLGKDLSWYFRIPLWFAFSLMFAIIAASCGKFISQDAEGSGIPEIKAIIGGVELQRYLSYLTLTSKTVGLIAASAAGLSIGREGPFIHISCIIADKITAMPLFQTIMSPALHKQILATAVAVGVSSTFGSPIGGLLFSIEVTATYYNVSNLWKSLYTATLCCLLFKFFGIDELTNLITSRHYAEAALGPQLIPFIFQGLIFGIIGSCFVYLAGQLIEFKKSHGNLWVFQRYTYTICVCFICALIVYVFDVYQHGDRLMIKYMFQPEKVEDQLGKNAKFHMITYSIGKFVMTLISVSCPIPCGVFTPIFALGAVTGRLYGEMCNYMFDSTHPGVYALIGAACLASSVTHTISVIVIVFELSGQISYLPFMLVGVLCSYSITTLLSSGIYDMLISLRKIPYMPTIKKKEFYNWAAKNVMRSIKPLHNVTSMKHLWNTVALNITGLRSIPITDDSSIIIGEVTLLDLVKFIYEEYLKIRSNLINRSTYDRYFEIFYEAYQDEFNHICIDQCCEILKQFNRNDDFTEPELKRFWLTKVMIQYSINLEMSPLTVTEDAAISKIHFLFVVLNLSQVYVTSRGQLSGVITRDSFLKNDEVINT